MILVFAEDKNLQKQLLTFRFFCFFLKVKSTRIVTYKNYLPHNYFRFKYSLISNLKLKISNVNYFFL